MNVQRLIEKYKKLEGVWDAEGAELARQIFLEDLKQLDEQKPVKVPQCVADWYEANKDNLDYNIWEYIYEWDNQKKSEFKSWFSCSREAFKTLVNMNQFGYEVEEEKRYTVVMKATKQPLYYNAMDKKLFFSMGGLATKFTRKQLEEAGVGWVFDCEGIDIEEVEE
ncbi:phage protein [Streptococcus pneumoniae]|nr:phage protein [Streptococcus pneumoniae]CIP82032.1 phage protein [Streptococcus pneumoniae]